MTPAITHALFALALSASPLAAQTDVLLGDPAQGEKDFKKCRACHSITGPDGPIVKGGKVGPNLYGVIGRQMGSVQGYKYSKGFTAAYDAGFIWDEESVIAFVADPSGYLSEKIGEKARPKMSFRALGTQDIVAYLATFSAAEPALAQ